MRIDRDRRHGEGGGNGRWLLTGSQQFQLMANVSESLAGRIALLELPPFSLLEASEEQRGGLQDIVWNGATDQGEKAPSGIYFMRAKAATSFALPHMKPMRQPGML